MSQPYVGEIRMFGGNFAPAGWAFCNGQTLPISENETLFQLIGTTYGGDGQETFQLPNLQSRIPMHMGTGPDGTTYQIGEAAGVESVTLTTSQIPAHNHSLNATSTGQQQAPGGNTLPSTVTAASAVNPHVYGPLNTAVQLSGNTIGASGGSQPHDNMQPFLCVSFIISLFGIFPSQS
jgi:microcystin-dependent protein